jgi:WD40 repeat protein
MALAVILALTGFRLQEAEERQDLHGTPLPEGAVARLGGLPFWHGQAVKSISLSPGGRFLATLTGDGVLRVWDRTTGGSLFRRRALPAFDEDRPTGTLFFSPDGRAVALSGGPGEEGSTRVWESATGRVLSRIEGRCQAFSPDGSLLYGAGTRAVRRWDVRTGMEFPRVAEDPKVERPILALSPDGRTLASSPRWGVELALWDLETDRKLLDVRPPPSISGDGPFAIGFSPDGKRLAVGGRRGIGLFDIVGGRWLESAVPRAWGLASVRFSPDGRWLLGEAAGHAGVWELETGRRLFSWDPSWRERGATALSTDGTILARAAGNGVELEPWAGRGPVPGPQGHSRGITAVAFTPAGRAVTAGPDGTVRFWEIETGKELRRLAVPGVMRMALSKDGTMFATSDLDGTVRLREAGTGNELARWEGEHLVASLAFSPDGRTLGAGGLDHKLVLWEVPGGKERIRRRNLDHGIALLAFAPDGKGLAWAEEDGALTFAEPEKGRDFLRLAPRGEIRGLAFAPDGKSLVTGDEAGTVRVREWPSARELRSWSLQGGGVHGLAVSSDGARVATVGLGGMIQVWEIATGKELARFRGHDRAARAIAFAPDGRHVVSGSADLTALVWELR